MTVEDFNIEFDLLYNNILSNSAPEVNIYEKSLFLTQAQEEIIKEAYSDKKTGTSFESTEAIRRRLNEVSITKTSTYDSGINNSLSSLKISSDSKFFKIEDDVWYITFEKAISSTKRLYVVPVSLDDFNMLEGNPFKSPNKKRAWRLDLKNTETEDKVVEIISDQTLTSYFYKYLQEPTPIVIDDLDTVYPDQNLTVNGVNTKTECILNSEVHRIILKRAVELATMAYKDNTLQNNVQLNNRNN